MFGQILAFGEEVEYCYYSSIVLLLLVQDYIVKEYYGGM